MENNRMSSKNCSSHMGMPNQRTGNPPFMQYPPTGGRPPMIMPYPMPPMNHMMPPMNNNMMPPMNNNMMPPMNNNMMPPMNNNMMPPMNNNMMPPMNNNMMPPMNNNTMPPMNNNMMPPMNNNTMPSMNNNMAMPMNGSPMPYYYQVPLQEMAIWKEGELSEEEWEEEINRMVERYPATAKEIQNKVTELCETLDYEGSRIYDEYPDRLMLQRYSDKIHKDMNLDDKLKDLVEVLLHHEIFRRRCRRGRCRRW